MSAQIQTTLSELPIRKNGKNGFDFNSMIFISDNGISIPCEKWKPIQEYPMKEVNLFPKNSEIISFSFSRKDHKKFMACYDGSGKKEFSFFVYYDCKFMLSNFDEFEYGCVVKVIILEKGKPVRYEFVDCVDDIVVDFLGNFK